MIRKAMFLILSANLIALVSGCIYNTSNYYAVGAKNQILASPTTVDKPVTTTPSINLEGKELGEALGTAIQTAITP